LLFFGHSCDLFIAFGHKVDKKVTKSSFFFYEAAVEGNSDNIRNWLKLVRAGGIGSTIFIRLLTADSPSPKAMARQVTRILGIFNKK